MNIADRKRYRSAEWNFALDIPKRWHAFPPVSSNSALEVIRFASREEGNHLVIMFRGPHDPKQPLKEVCDQARQILVGQGFGNFSTIVEMPRESPKPLQWMAGLRCRFNGASLARRYRASRWAE